MFLDQSTAWVASHWPLLLTAAALAALAAGVCALIVHRTSGAVVTAGLGALVCTAYSADTSWGFAEHRLGMTDHDERLVMFAAGEFALIACGIMARANKRATATSDQAGTPGVPGVLVWVLTGIQIIPAYSESGFWGGTVRAVIGPVMAGMLWHLAMGLEIRVRRPEALSTGLPAQIGHELRERLLSHLGLATRNRTAEEITRDRAHARAVRLGARRHLGPWGRARLAAAVTRSRAAVNGGRRHHLLQDLAGRRTADQLRTMPVPSPWEPAPADTPHPATPLGVAGAALRRMHPMDAIQAVRDAHPAATPAELAALTTEYGVPVGESLVRIALHPKATQPPILGVQPQPAPALEAAAEPQSEDDPAARTTSAAPAQAQPPARPVQPHPATEHPPAAPASPETDAQPGTALVLDLAPMLPPQPETKPGHPPVPPAAQPSPPQPAQPVSPLRAPDADAQLLDMARLLNELSLGENGKKASLRLLQTELGIGQRRAQRIQAQLPDALPAAVAAAQPTEREA